jgi:hypothetical protein
MRTSEPVDRAIEVFKKPQAMALTPLFYLRNYAGQAIEDERG